MGIPTKFRIDHRCGHKQLIDLANNPNDKLNRGPLDREEFAGWLSKKWADPNKGRDCDKCFKASNQQDADLNERQWMLDIEDFETKYSLPELRGTEKMFTSGLVDSARKDRYSVLSVLFAPDQSEYMDQHGHLLDAVRALDWAGFWTNHLGVKKRTDRNYGQAEFVELITAGVEQEKQRQAQFADSAPVETENPF